MAEKRADLHIHSTFSDGTLSPEEIVELAAEAGLAAISVTDHDNVAGVERAEVAARRHGLEVIPGVELSAIEIGTDVHVLGYFVDVGFKSLTEHLELFRDARRIRAQKMVEKLKDLGLEVSIEAVLAKAGPAAVGRPHVAEALVDEGLILSYEEAFRRYIGFDGPAYVPKYEISPARAVDLIHAAGGLAIIAHPGVYLRDDIMRSIIAAGIDGIETVHPKHTAEATSRLRAMVKELGLVETGGSDYHGDNRGNTPFGDGTIPYDWVEILRERAGR